MDFQSGIMYYLKILYDRFDLTPLHLMGFQYLMIFLLLLYICYKTVSLLIYIMGSLYSGVVYMIKRQSKSKEE